MAITAKVINMGTYILSTDKGSMKGRTIYIDVPVYENESYDIHTMSDGRNILPYKEELNSFYTRERISGVVQTTNTTFITDNGLISYGHSGGDLKFTIKNFSDDTIFSAALINSSYPTTSLLPFLIIGSNGIPFIDTTSVVNTYVYTNIQQTTFVKNTTNEFGTFKNDYNNFTWNASNVIADRLNLTIGEIFYVSANLKNYDPYAPGGESEPGGGDGDFDNDNDNVDFPDIPALSAVTSGLLTIYSPLLADLVSLANFLWSGLFDIDTLKKLFSDPMQAIISLGIVPLTITGTTPTSVYFGNVDTGLSMPKVNNQYITVDCGNINIKKYFGSYLDYEPYTKIEIYLPFIGFHQLSTDDLMGNNINLKYYFDLLTGSCVAIIKSGIHVLYSFSGQCLFQIPVTASNWNSLLTGIITSATSIGAAAVGAATVPLAMGKVASTAINSAKPTIEKSGSLSGTAGLLANKTPYLVITRPRQCVPKNQNKFIGYPSFINKKIGDLSGYTEIESIHLQGIPCTSEELNEIENILKGGVIL